MKIRTSSISASIARAISRHYITSRKSGKALLRRILAFFSFFKLFLKRYRPVDFLALRHDAWRLDEEEYLSSFEEGDSSAPSSSADGASTTAGQSSSASGNAGKKVQKRKRPADLVPIGDLGYSGSTFFTTANGKYLVKSLPRRFEHSFFTHELLDGYAAHMKESPESLLVRITDMVYTPYPTLGGILGTAPTHHIVMENLLFGKDREKEDEMKDKWETYDLKPSSYFFPERDIADGMLVPDSVIERLIDEFPGKITVSLEAKEELITQLNWDTQLLQRSNAVDYSLFVVRFPGPHARDESSSASPAPEGVQSRASKWRSGMDDANGEWTYRVVVLDFFWAKNKFQAQAMTGLVKAFNVVAGKGPMSITTTPEEYRVRFMKMVDEMVVTERQMEAE